MSFLFLVSGRESTGPLLRGDPLTAPRGCTKLETHLTTSEPRVESISERDLIQRLKFLVVSI